MPLFFHPTSLSTRVPCGGGQPRPTPLIHWLVPALNAIRIALAGLGEDKRFVVYPLLRACEFMGPCLRGHASMIVTYDTRHFAYQFKPPPFNSFSVRIRITSFWCHVCKHMTEYSCNMVAFSRYPQLARRIPVMQVARRGTCFY